MEFLKCFFCSLTVLFLAQCSPHSGRFARRLFIILTTWSVNLSWPFFRRVCKVWRSTRYRTSVSGILFCYLQKQFVYMHLCYLLCLLETVKVLEENANNHWTLGRQLLTTTHHCLHTFLESPKDSASFCSLWSLHRYRQHSWTFSQIKWSCQLWESIAIW